MTSNTLKLIYTYLGVLGVFFALTGCAYKLIIHNTNQEKRTEVMKRFKYIIVGSLIISLILPISSILYNTSTKMAQESVTNEKYTVEEIEISEDKATFIEKLLAAPFSAFNNFLLGDSDNEGLASRLLGTTSLDELFFNKSVVNMSGGSTGTEESAYGPFTSKEWNSCMYIYVMLLSVVIPLIIIMVGKTGLMYIKSNSVAKLEEAKEATKRWVFIVILLACSPIFLKVFFMFIDSFTGTIYDRFESIIKNSPILGAKENWDSVKSGSVLVTAVMKFIYAGLYFIINASFVARKWVLICMICVSPIIFTLWGIKDKVHAFDLWLGEVITNAVMGLTYGLVFIIFSVFMSEGTNMLSMIIGLSMAVTLSETLRNSLQGFFTRMAGVNESRAGIRGLGMAGTILAGGLQAMGVKGGNTGNVTGGMMNAMEGLKGGANGETKASTTTSAASSGSSTTGSSSATKTANTASGMGSAAGKVSSDSNLSAMSSNGISSVGNNATGASNSTVNEDAELSADGVGTVAEGLSGNGEEMIPEMHNHGSADVENDAETTVDPEPNVSVSSNGMHAARGNEAVNKLKTMVGEGQEFANILNKKYNSFDTNRFSKGATFRMTGGFKELNPVANSLASVGSSVARAGAMGISVLEAGRHIASQRAGEKVGLFTKESFKTANEMLRMNKVTSETDGNGGVKLDIKKGNAVSGAFNGLRLVNTARSGANAAPKILVNNSLQSKINNTYVDWSKIQSSTFNGKEA